MRANTPTIMGDHVVTILNRITVNVARENSILFFINNAIILDSITTIPVGTKLMIPNITEV